jgi:hypothetical protein
MNPNNQEHVFKVPFPPGPRRRVRHIRQVAPPTDVFPTENMLTVGGPDPNPNTYPDPDNPLWRCHFCIRWNRIDDMFCYVCNKYRPRMTDPPLNLSKIQRNTSGDFLAYRCPAPDCHMWNLSISRICDNPFCNQNPRTY